MLPVHNLQHGLQCSHAPHAKMVRLKPWHEHSNGSTQQWQYSAMAVLCDHPEANLLLKAQTHCSNITDSSRVLQNSAVSACILHEQC